MTQPTPVAEPVPEPATSPLPLVLQPRNVGQALALQRLRRGLRR